MKIVRVNVDTGAIIYEEIGQGVLTGGRHLISCILKSEINPVCEPLGAHNKLVLAAGPLSGTFVSGANRLSAGGKSPLTGTAKEANGGGIAGLRMGENDITGIIFEGRPPAGNNLQGLYIGPGGAKLFDAEDLAGKGVYESAKILHERYGRETGLILIGPAGEMQLTGAGVTGTDKDGVPSRYCGRGGMGAVMGAKKIKAVVIEKGSRRTPADKMLFRETLQQFNQILREAPSTGKAFPDYGTVEMLDLTSALGGLPTRNFTSGSFEFSNQLSAETLCSNIRARGGEGEVTHGCMPGCIVRCSNIYTDVEGKTIVSPLEYESICLLGSNLEISDLDVVARLNYHCNDIGLDTIDTGAAIGVCMEAGILEFGDGQGALRLMEEIRKGTVLGRIIGHGAATAGKVLGVRRTPAVKGQALSAYEPRAIKGLGTTYATSTMGADHTSGNTVRYPVDHRDPKQQAEASRKAQVLAALYDSLGMCVFNGTAIKSQVDVIAKMVSSFTGMDVDADGIYAMAEETLTNERDFNKRAGFGPAHDRLPEFFYEEENPATGTVFDVSDEDLQQVKRYDLFQG